MCATVGCAQIFAEMRSTLRRRAGVRRTAGGRRHGDRLVWNWQVLTPRVVVDWAASGSKRSKHGRSGAEDRTNKGGEIGKSLRSHGVFGTIRRNHLRCDTRATRVVNRP